MRVDLNGMVKKINLKKESGRYSDKYLVKVTLFNDVVIDFNDSDKLYDLFVARQKCGTLSTLVKSQKLVEEEKKSGDVLSEELEEAKTYFCVLHELNLEDGVHQYRSFLSNPKVDRQVIIEYYKLWKSQQKAQPQAK